MTRTASSLLLGLSIFVIVGLVHADGFPPLSGEDDPFSSFNFNTTDLSSACVLQFAELSTNGDDFTRTVISWGKSLGDTGKFWLCDDINIAKYCLMTINLQASGFDAPRPCSISAPNCNIGICIPEACSASDINALLSQAEDSIGFFATNNTLVWDAHCQVDTSIRGNPLSWVGIASLALIVGSVVVATIIHMINNGTLHTLISRVEVAPLEIHDPTTVKGEEKGVELQNIASDKDFNPAADIEEQIQLNIMDDEDELENEVEEKELRFKMKDEPGNTSQPHLLSEEELENEEKALLEGEIELLDDEEEVIEETKKSALFETFADCFSISKNFNRLLNPIPGEFGSLNALRVFSMLWVIWGHTLFFWGQIGAVDLQYTYRTILHQFYIQAAMSGIFAVDSFFFLSGFLGAYFLYERLLDGKGMAWPVVYFHRIWRILPVYCFMMLIYVTMIPVLGDGPFWFKLQRIIENTSPNCWSNLLFINNIYPTSTADQCMGWGWFLAVDMQFFIVSPPLIYIQYKKPILGWTLLGIWLAQDLTTSTVLSAVRGYSPSIIKVQPGFFAEFYQRPYCRASPYIVGMSCGYIYSYIRRNKPDFKIPMAIIHIGYAISLSTMAVIVYSIYWDDQWNQFENSLYLGFSRFAWGLSIGWLNMTMFLGYGGLLRKFFFARLWQPLAKLTYGAYLCHPIFMFIFYFDQWQYIVIQNRTIWYTFFGHAVCAFSFAVIAYLLVEKPFMNLEPYLIKGAIRLVFKAMKKPLPKQYQ